MRSLIVALVLAALAPLARADRAPVKVAVVPGIVVNLDPGRVDALTQELAEALRAVLEVDAIGGVEVRRRLPPGGLASSCVATEACIADVARRLEAQQLLFVVMIDTGTGGAIQIDSTWIDATAHRSAPRPAIDIATVDDARVRFIAMAPQLLPDATVRPKPRAASLGKMSDPVPRHFAISSYLTAGGALVGLGTGIALGLDTRTRYQDCTDQAHQGTACSQSRTDAIRRRALIADAGWLVAIGGAIATAVLYASSDEASHVIVEPVPGGAAVTAVGSF
ncbi:MAG TPA: hypothetical protein VK601_18155 [Kofleriaceae bacterium]|nr:hypothetical protein [Kofleriaceae bacterium]